MQFATTDTPIPIHVFAPGSLESWTSTLDAAQKAQLETAGFAAKLGEAAVLLDQGGRPAQVAAGWGSAAERARQQFPLAGLGTQLPKGDYALASLPEGADPGRIALGWLLNGYRFERYRSQGSQPAGLTVPDGIDATRIEAQAQSARLTMDLINTPANDMGPGELEFAAQALAEEFGAAFAVIRGDDLLTQNFPMIHAVGRASDKAPRLIDFAWGDADAPRVTLVGKGVCFDTGGLNLKPGSSMGLMKKDMGGAATVLGLARLIMVLGLPVRLRVLIPAVENSVSAGAFRPGDILTARNGLTVEVNNTDAEGRLVLADALALGGEDEPEIMVSMATLTGAARVALGPDMPPFFTDDDHLAGALTAAAESQADPLWRLPFWNPYEDMIEPGIADLDNAPKGGFAGAITAALFLRRFAGGAGSYAHFDVYGWNPTAKPGRPKGGAAQGARAVYSMLEERYGG